MNFFHRFQVGDKVTYIGAKFAQQLSGSLGIVTAHVKNSQTGVVVTFGDDAYVMCENKHLTRFQGRVKDPQAETPKEEKPKDVEITKRRGGKRRTDQDDG